jgi:molecular chaperone IbpA
MTKFSLSIPELHRSVIGFDRLFEQAERRLQNLTQYPPHNIVKVSESDYEIEFAVAGFQRDELSVELHEGVLTATGEHKLNQDRHYIHQGIANRHFKKSLQLGEYMEIVGAQLENGILVVHVEHQLPDAKKPKQIEIS